MYCTFYSRTRLRRISDRFVRVIGGFLHVCLRVKIPALGALERLNWKDVDLGSNFIIKKCTYILKPALYSA
jgi:hypothetical protein